MSLDFLLLEDAMRSKVFLHAAAPTRDRATNRLMVREYRFADDARRQWMREQWIKGMEFKWKDRHDIDAKRKRMNAMTNFVQTIANKV
jgi:hypothetical protein